MLACKLSEGSKRTLDEAESLAVGLGPTTGPERTTTDCNIVLGFHLPIRYKDEFAAFARKRSCDKLYGAAGAHVHLVVVVLRFKKTDCQGAESSCKSSGQGAADLGHSLTAP
jgi:hypothetical protein